jgi:hypothetical protein
MNEPEIQTSILLQHTPQELWEPDAKPIAAGKQTGD